MTDGENVSEESHAGSQFIGRTTDIRLLLNRIGSIYPQSCSVVGIRRIGKTALLRHVREMLGSPSGMPVGISQRYLCVSLDMATLPSKEPADLIRLLTQETRQTARERGVYIGDTVDPELFHDLERLLSDLASQGFRCIYFLDEFDCITAIPQFGAVFFDALRSLAGGELPVAFVTSSYRELHSLCHSVQISTSPFFNIFTTLRLRLLKPEDARSFIRKATTEKASVEDEEFLLRLAGPHPSMLQQACRLYTERTQQSSTGMTDYESFRQSFQESTVAYYRFLWHDLSRSEKQALLSLVSGQLTDPTSPEGIELERKGLLYSDHGVLIPFSDAFRDFLRSYREPDKLKQLATIIYENMGENLVEEWLQQQTKNSHRIMCGPTILKLEEFLLDDDHSKVDALNLLGLPTLRRIGAALTGEKGLPTHVPDLSRVILHHLGFSVAHRPEGICTGIETLSNYVKLVVSAPSHNETFALGMRGCHECEKILRELCEFYAIFFFGALYIQPMAELHLIPKKNDIPLDFSRMTFGQRKDALLRLQSCGEKHMKSQYQHAFGRPCVLLPKEAEDLLAAIGKARGERFAHETPQSGLFDLPLNNLKAEVKTILDQVGSVFEIWRREKIYPQVFVYWGEWVDHHGLRLYHGETEGGEMLKVRTPQTLQPGMAYYCYSKTNPIALDPVLVAKQLG